MDPRDDFAAAITRRHFFQRGGLGLGGAALASMAVGLPAAASGGGDGLPGVPHFAPKAKRAIWLFMAGAPSQIDTLDYKPKLHDLFDTDLPDSIRKGQRLTTMTSGQKRFPIAPSKYRFTKTDNGGDGAWVSELLPYTASMTEDLAIVRSVYTEAINHDPAITFITTGRELPGRPSLGSWLSYGLGTANRDLPGFVVMTPRWSGRRDAQALYNRLWGAGMLPSRHAGTALRPDGDPVLFLQNPGGVDAASRRRMLDALGKMNARLHAQVGDPEIQTRIAQYELAYRMQTSVPELNDLGSEPESTFAMYGEDARQPGTFASSCLLARRMVERGVRFVQIFHRGWDHHSILPKQLPGQCFDVDQPSAALLIDLKRRGLLDDTLVVFAGEFGRTVYGQGRLTREDYGRDHHPRCFSGWLAGGGVAGGVHYGATDDFSYNVARDPVSVHDLHATMLHLCGVDHRRMTFRSQGLDERLTGVEPARVIRGMLS